MSFPQKATSSPGGHVNTIGAYYSGQNANGAPDHYVSLEESKKLRKSGKARSIHRGRAIIILGLRNNEDFFQPSMKRAWKVVGQTQKNAIKPGMPRYGSV